MAGNVATPEMVQQILESGADIVKVGIGSGKTCQTRLMTGCGVPQLSAISDCADAAHGYGGLICSDGGCRSPGDVCKSIAAGADLCMLGGMLAGTDECDGRKIQLKRSKEHVSSDDPSEWFRYQPNESKEYTIHMEFYGMSSEYAMNQHNDGVADYKACEGRRIFVETKGPVKGPIQAILGGLRSACTYVGASTLKHLPKCATFIRVSTTHRD